MAEKRMFSLSIMDSDAFLEMPLSSQALYVHLGVRADDDGFVNNPKRIMRMVGCAEDDLKLLIAKHFLIAFESGIVAIKHWHINNYLRKDRYKPSVYQEERNALYIKPNRAYTLDASQGVRYVLFTESCWQLDSLPDGIPDGVQDGRPVGIPDGNQSVDSRYTQNSIDKNSIDKSSVEKKRKEKKNNNAQDDSSDESSDSPVVSQIILNDKTYFGVTQDMVDTWSQLYPSADIMQELRKMAGWADANPSKRKTKSGVKRFINSWLSRVQDSGRSSKKPETDHSLDGVF